MKLAAIRMLTSLILVVVLAACVPLQGRLAQADIDSGKVIAVVSVLGQTFHGIHFGTTVFTNESYDVNVPEWNIDAIAEQAMQSYLTRSGSVRAFVLKHDQGIQERYRGRSTLLSGYNYEEITALAKAQGADIVIVAVPSVPDGVRWKPGYGFVENVFFGSTSRFIYMASMFIVLSARDGKQLGWEWGLPWAGSGVTDFEWKNGFDKYSPRDLDTLQELTVANVKDTVARALSRLGY